MPTGTVRPPSNMLSSGDTSSQWTPSVWDNMNLEAIREGNEDGIIQEWHFGTLKASSNINAAEAYWDQGLLVFGSDGGTLTYSAGVGLANGITVASDGDNEGVGIRSQRVPYRLSRADRAFAMEVVLQTSIIDDTEHGFFVGLMDNTAATATSPIAAAGTLANVNFVGFHRLEGDGDKLDLVYKADGVTQVSQFTDAITLVAATDVRLGLTYRPEADFDNGRSYVFRWWLNGKPIADTGTSAGSLGWKQIPSTAGDDFPNDVAMGFTFNLLNATATTPGSTTLRRCRIAQYF